MEFFESIGVTCRAREDGRVYPLCEQAAAVLDCLRAECAARGVTEQVDTAVTSIRPGKGGFLVETAGGNVSAGAVLVEVGAAGNTRQEALLAAEYLANAIIALADGGRIQ
jgi:predicted flavoprotein YhiN